ncbi:uncharacterized protein LOC107364615 [Tetranychus urticae]|uniref:Sushi domain-containing protein n=1 Tax=Tetranychus urticae TaxID=32264 RepID=T1KIH7_TETUR|nr:uncharacterized protein LOC107364615 [Tetranychus urticae]
MSTKLGAPFIQTTIVTLFHLSFLTLNPSAARWSGNPPEYQLFRTYSSNQCPPLDIANGYVRIGRRTARFRCQRNFTLVGDQVIYCRGDEWSGKIPVCAAAGCLKLRAPKQGIIKSTYRDVSATISCNPGYSVEGSATVYCDGRYWNASYTQISNMCKKSLKDPLTSCDFESYSLCGWTSDDPERIIWTGSDSYQYRPYGILSLTDHSGTGHMMLAWSSTSPTAINRLYSPVFEAKHSEACFVFWYHLGEVDKITNPSPFKIYIKPELIALSDVTPWDFVTPVEAYSKWTSGQVYVPKLNQDWQIVFEFSSWQNIYAFDDFSLQDATQCASRTAQFTGIKNNWLSCKDRCSSSLALEPASSCSCIIYCTFLDTCCPDYSLYCLANSTKEDNDDLMDFDKNDTNETSSITLSTLETTSGHYVPPLPTLPLTTLTWLFTTYPTATTQSTTKQPMKTVKANLTTQSPVLMTDTTKPSSTNIPVQFPVTSPTSVKETKVTALINGSSLSTSSVTQQSVTTTTESVNKTLTTEDQKLIKTNSSTDIASKNTTDSFGNSTLLDSVEIINQTTTLSTHDSSIISSRSNNSTVKLKSFNGEKAKLSVSQSSKMETISILLGAFMIVSLISVVILWKKHKKIFGSSVSADSELRFLAQEEDN